MSTARRTIVLAVGTTAGAAAVAVLGGGLLAPRAADVAGAQDDGVLATRTRPVAATALPAFTDCEQLRRWYVARALPQVGPWGFGVPVLAYAERSSAGPASGAAPVPAAGPSGALDAVGSSATGTNVQEAGVDEADVAKTDGRLVVRLDDRSLVVTDVSEDTPVELSRTRLPGPRLSGAGLLLHGDTAVVVGDQPTYRSYRGPVPDVGSVPSDGVPDIGRTSLPQRALPSRAAIVSLDLADPAHPQVTGRQVVDGGAVSTREYSDGTVRVVVTTGYPSLPFVSPGSGRSTADAARANRAIVRGAPAEAWLPGVRADGGARTPLLDCSDVRHPAVASGFGTLSVLAFPADDPSALEATAVTAAGDLAYSSADRLYVATSREPGGGGVVTPLGEPSGPLLDDTATDSRVAPPLRTRTTIHAFALDGPRTTYVASGTVKGSVEDRWSLDEYDGHLRVAVATGPSWRPSDNAVVVLAERGDRLVETGRVDGLGRHEQIQSVRWLDDLAVVVTFRQTDPLYTLDLADPSAPRLLGALKVPGFSSYLHPLGGDRLLGIGHDVSRTGVDHGAQAATFDLRDTGDVRRTSVLALGRDTDVGVGWDPRAFAYVPSERTLVLPVQSWTTGRSRFVAVRVGADGSLERTGSWVARSWDPTGVRALPLGGDRVALVGDVVRVLHLP